MNKRQWDTVLYGIAEDQAGYFTAAQARAAGLHQVRLVQLTRQGDIARVSRGVYRFARFPVSRHGHFMEACSGHRSAARTSLALFPTSRR
jgi:hypothetical protein